MNRVLLLAGMVVSLCATAVGQTELIGNGGFELNTSAPWLFNPAYGTQGAALISNVSGYAHTGSYFLLMGNTNSANQTAYQQITIPTNTTVATLNYDWYLFTQDVYGVDNLKVWIVSTNLAILATVDLESNSFAYPGYWMQKSFDMTPYIGQTVDVYFAVTTDPNYGYATSFLIDDVSVLAATASQLPANDSFTNSMVLTGISVTNYSTNTFATKEPGEPDHGGNAGGRSLWWNWTAPSNSLVTIKTVGSTFNTLLGVYTGTSVSNLTQIASDNGIYDNTGTAQVQFGAIAGTQYQIAVDGYNGDNGGIVLKLTAVQDNQKPTVAITYPGSGKLTLADATIVVTGKSADNFGVAGVQCRLENAYGTNDYMLATGTTNWTATFTNLVPGLNTVRAFAYDGGSNASPTVARSFTYIPGSLLTLTVSGYGTVSPNYTGKILTIGANYTLTAKPSSGAVFTNWTGSLASTSLKITFQMQNDMTIQANFIANPFNTVAGNYQGLYYDTNDVLPQSSGFVSASVKTSGSFSAKLQSGGTRYSVSGLFPWSGAYSNSIARRGMGPLSVQLQLDMTGDTLSGVIGDGTNTSQLLAYRDVYSKSFAAPTNYAGNYTMLIPGAETSDEQPGGDGWGTIKVDAYGNVTLTGSLADGTKISQKTFVSAESVWPLFAANGAMFGWVTLTNDPASDMDGTLTWFKMPNAKSKFYQAGFTNQSDFVASRYLYTNNVPVLNFTNGEVWLSNGNLSQSFTNFVLLGSNNKVTGTNKLSLTITTSSGAFKGSALSPDTGKPLSFTGVILEKQGFGGGYFAGTNQVGRVWFGAPELLPALGTDPNGASSVITVRAPQKPLNPTPHP